MKNSINLHKFNLIMNETDNLYHQVALKLHLSDSAMFILYIIYDNGGKCLLNEICSFGICKQTINSAIRKLESDEIIKLEMYNGKSKIAVFTENGEIFAKQTIGRLFKAEANVFNNWTEEEMDSYIKLSQKYLKDFKKEIEKI